MTWADIQLASIRKMFVNTTAISATDLPTMKQDKKYITYLDAMPDAATEGLVIMATRGKPIISRSVLQLEDDSEEASNETTEEINQEATDENTEESEETEETNEEENTSNEVVETYPIDGFYCFNIAATLTNYIQLENVYVDGKQYEGYVLRDNIYLYIPEDIYDNHTIVVSYNSSPRITKSTLDTYIINAPIDMLNILPLYIASELYKDDDISLATYYRNEFETELENMRKQPTDIHFVDVKGWL
jgi:hypothetical protein